MFVPIKSGTEELPIGTDDPFHLQCPQCKQIGTLDFVISAEYFHFYWIPMFPTGKDGYAKCSECEFMIRSLKFNRVTSEYFKEIKGKYSYPIKTYAGIIVIFFPILVSILLLIFKG